jgi:hypothetical protein
MSKRGHYGLITVVLALACAIAGYAFVANRIAHPGEGSRHTYPLSGDYVLSDRQAIDLAKQTLQLDGRYSEKMEQVTFGNGSVASRGDDRSHYVSLCWQEPGTNKKWYVQLHRTPEHVDAVSYPGK